MKNKKPTPLQQPRIPLRVWFGLLLVLLVGIVLAPQAAVLGDSIARLRAANSIQVIVAIAFVAATFVLGAATYCILAFKPILYGRTLVAQTAANFVNRLLPAGLGGIGLNYRYLHTHRHTAGQAAAVVAANNLLGLAGHVLIVATMSLIYARQLQLPRVSARLSLLLFCIVAVILLVVASLPQLRLRLVLGFRTFSAQMAVYRHKKWRVLLGLVCQMALTLCNVAALWFCLRAVNVNLSYAVVLLIFTVGFGVGTAVPTPGGLGGVEAGLVAGVVVYGIAAPAAVAGVLVYRLASYWLPLLCSAGFFAYASRRRYFG